MHHTTFRQAIPFILATALFVVPGCGADVDGGGSGGSGGTGNGAGGGTGTTSGGSGGGATGTGGSADGGLTCDERLTSAIQQVDAVLQAHLTCATDADCTTVDVSTACAGSCPEAVNLQGATAVQAEVADVNATVCSGYQDDGCPYATPGCAPPSAVTCTGGTCTLVF